jgi:hypothetical protein
MKSKTISLSFLFCFISSVIFAQSFMHSVGANISVMFAKIETPSLKEDFAMEVTHLSYFPRFILTESDNSSFTVGTPVGVGINIINDVSGESGIAWGFDAPLVFDYNMGCKSSPENENGFGGYFGAGFGYMYTSYTFGYGDEKATSYGPIGRAGIRFLSGGGRFATTIGMYFKTGLEKQKFKTVGFNILADF